MVDPNAALRDIHAALQLGHTERALILANRLTEWLSEGGFAPNWQQYWIAARWFINRTEPALRQPILTALA